MAQNAHAPAVDLGQPQQQRNGLGGVAQHLAHERVAPHQAIAKLVVVLHDIFFVGFGACALAPPVFKTDRVRRQHDDPLPGQRRPERLQGVARQAAYLALAEVALAGVLMVDEHSRKRSLAVGEQEIGGDQVAFRAGIADAEPAIAVRRLARVRHKVDGSLGNRESQECSDLLA